MLKFVKYHALGNSFIVLDELPSQKPKINLEKLAVELCDSSFGVGADGIIILSDSKKADYKFDIYNADGSWAEKSGNGLRCVGLHLYLNRKRKKCTIETTNSIDEVIFDNQIKPKYFFKTTLGTPEFDTGLIPVKTKQKYLINSPIKVSGYNFPMTCLSVGNPHAVLFVNKFDFDWQVLGEEIENLSQFPNRTNVEFVKIVTKKKIKVKDWERGAGPTGSSGTGAAASVVAGVMNGQLDRECQVDFEKGSLYINWHSDNDIVELSGPVEFICKGTYNI
ncbi:MAG: diaminopimelate epimerase [candidate division Zixibacteria bacterium]|nr:diaminopimelate epimerase [candidate division Zixibacteria bacterium]